MNQPVHIPRALWERLIARFRTSSIAVSKDHGCSKVQQWRRTTDVDFRQPTEKKKKERNVEAGSISLYFSSKGRRKFDTRSTEVARKTYSVKTVRPRNSRKPDPRLPNDRPGSFPLAISHSILATHL